MFLTPNSTANQKMPLWWAPAIVGASVFAAAAARSAGTFTPHGVEAVASGLGLLVVAWICMRPGWRLAWPALLWPLGAAGLALLNLSPAIDPAGSPAALTLAIILAASAAALCLPLPRVSQLFAAVTAAAADIGLALIQVTWGRAPIDVFDFTQGAAQRLLHLQNPYGGIFPSTTPGVPYLHFPYLPGVLIATAPFRLLGDIRVANAAAMLVLFGSIWAVGRRHVGSPWSERWFAIALAVPLPARMVLMAWPEVYLVAAIAAWLALREDHPRWGALVLGLGICTVPTPLPLLAIPWLWWPSARREITAAAVLAIILCVPFAAWAGFGNFFHDVVVVQLHAPTRLDALTINSFLAHLHRGFLPTWVGILVPGLVLLLAAALGPRGWDSAFLLGSVLLTVIFLTAKWAFFDYYFIVVYAVILGLSLGPPQWEAKPNRGLGRVGAPT